MAKLIEREWPSGRLGPPRRSDPFREVIDLIRERGMLDQLVITPAARSYDHAEEIRRGINRSAWYYCSCGEIRCTRQHDNIAGCPDGGQRISSRAEIVTRTGDDGRRHYHVQFQLHDKREAMRAMIDKYGTDRSKWPYDPRARTPRRKRG